MTRLRATRSRRPCAGTWPHSIRSSGAAPVLAAAAVVLIAAAAAVVVAAVRTSHPAPLAHRPAATLLKPPPARTPAPTPSPPAGVAGLRLVGANGAAAWELTATSLSVSQDAGRRWFTVPLPAGVVPSSITAVTAAGRGLWLAVWRSPAIDLYDQDAGTADWSRRTLVPLLPSSDAFLARQPPASRSRWRPRTW